MPVRNPEIVQVGHHYGMTIQTCVPADPQSKGGSEATVRIAKRDVVPTAVNLREQYRSFAELEQACRDFCDEVNHRPHRETRRDPAAMLAEEGPRLHALPAEPFTVAFGTTRRVSWDGTISVEGGKYSVPHPLVDTRVWARFHGDELIVTSVDDQGPHEVARHQRTRPGSPSICEEHYPPRRGGKRAPKPTSADETAFLALGSGAASWLTEAAAAGTRRIRPKMAEAIALAKLHGTEPVDRALGTAAIAGRFADNDLLSILDYQTDHDPDQPHSRADEAHSLQRGTAAWSQFGLPSPGGEA